MIKTLSFIRRRADLTPEQFSEHWRTRHGPLVRDTPTLARHIRRYEQNHRLPADYERERSDLESADGAFDGVAVQWFDSLAGFQAFASEPALGAVLDDEREFMEPEATVFVATRDADVIVDKPGGREAAGVKLVCIFRRHQDLEPETFHEHWLHHHGGLFQTIEDLNAPLLAYDQNHRLAETYGMRGFPDVDGVTEQWFADLDGFVSSVAAPSHPTVVEPDVAYMLDGPSIQFILAGPPLVIMA